MNNLFLASTSVQPDRSPVQGGPSPGGLGLVDLDMGCSTILLGQWVATVAAHQPGELPKSKSTQPSFARRWAILYKE